MTCATTPSRSNPSRGHSLLSLGRRLPFLRSFRLHALIFLLLLSPGCATLRGSTGTRLLREGDYERAVAAYRFEEARNPTDPDVKRNLGVALLRLGHFEAARRSLAESVAMDPNDARSLYFLGQAEEKLGQQTEALNSYQAAAALGGNPARGARSRIQVILREQAADEVRAALAREESLAAVPHSRNTLAVLDFRNPSSDADLAPLSKGLAAAVLTDLSKVRRFRVVERARLQVLLEELQRVRPERLPAAPELRGSTLAPWQSVLGQKQRLRIVRQPSGEPYYPDPSDDRADPGLKQAIRRFQKDAGLRVDGVVGPKTAAALDQAFDLERVRLQQVFSGEVDATTAPRVGRLLRARLFFQGSFLPIGAADIQLSGSLIDADSSTSSPVVSEASGERSHLLKLEKELVYQTLHGLGIEPTPEERQEIDRLPTESFEAFLAYSRGLSMADEGRFGDAARAFQMAVSADPGFSEAAASAEDLPLTEREIEQVDLTLIEPAPLEPGVTDQLRNDLMQSVSEGPAPDDGQGNASEGPGTGQESGDSQVTTSASDRIPDAPPHIPGFPPPPPPPPGQPRRAGR